MTLVSRLVLLCIAALPMLDAQFPTAQPLMAGACSAEGIVTDSVTGEPLSGAKVLVTALPGRGGPMRVNTVISGSGGNWRVAGVACDRVIITAAKPGYLSQSRGPGGTSSVQVAVSLQADAPSRDIRLQITHVAIVAGTIRDESGKPVPGAEIRVMTSVVKNGERVMSAGRGVIPDAAGAYKYGDLLSGSYSVCAGSNPDDLPAPHAVWTHYSKSCVSTELAANETKRLDFILRRIAGAHVRGVVTGLTPGAKATVHLKKYDETTESIADQDLPVDADMAFDFAGVPPGNYYLSASEATGGQPLTAYAPVVVESSDIQGVKLSLAAAVAVRGTIHFELAGVAGDSMASGIEPRLKAPSPLSAQAGPIQWDARHASFVFPSVSPGQYKFSLKLSNAYVSAAVLNGKDILDEDVTFRTDTGPIEITVRNDMGTIDGSTTGHDGQSGNSRVYAIRTGREPISGFSINGRFVARLPPGEYSLFAFPSDAPVLYTDPEWMLQYGGAGEKITVRANAASHINLVERATPLH